MEVRAGRNFAGSESAGTKPSEFIGHSAEPGPTALATFIRRRLAHHGFS